MIDGLAAQGPHGVAPRPGAVPRQRREGLRQRRGDQGLGPEADARGDGGALSEDSPPQVSALLVAAVLRGSAGRRRAPLSLRRAARLDRRANGGDLHLGHLLDRGVRRAAARARQPLTSCFNALPPRGRRAVHGVRPARWSAPRSSPRFPASSTSSQFLWRERTPALQWRLDYVFAIFAVFIAAAALRFFCEALRREMSVPFLILVAVFVGAGAGAHADRLRHARGRARLPRRGRPRHRPRRRPDHEHAVNNYLLVAIPMFLLAANLMNAGSISDRLFAACHLLVGPHARRSGAGRRAGERGLRQHERQRGGRRRRPGPGHHPRDGKGRLPARLRRRHRRRPRRCSVRSSRPRSRWCSTR